MKNFSRKETDKWLSNQSHKKSSSAVIFKNSRGQWLLLELTYKEGFGLAGGNSEKGESPCECAIREVKEELGLDVKLDRLLTIHYIYRKEYNSESIQFYFDGGVLNNEQISNIVLQASEIKDIHFINESEVENKLYSSMKLRFPYIKKALNQNIVTYFETKK